jgi:hypothetical protein
MLLQLLPTTLHRVVFYKMHISLDDLRFLTFLQLQVNCDSMTENEIIILRSLGITKLFAYTKKMWNHHEFPLKHCGTCNSLHFILNINTQVNAFSGLL